ncbi:MAG TPA: hydroxymethylbilane synthase [Nitrospirae bacterium]|nr:hydroxymethylbilane synthase [Nitrospirota bacterium]
MREKVLIGTRGSKLALWQAEWVASQLRANNPALKIELVKIKTTGDKITDVPLAKVGGKGLFVKEIEDALLSCKIDMAVHSMKDVPSEFPSGLYISAICKREDPRDAMICKKNSAIKSFKDIPHSAKIGTSSLRRTCQLLAERPDLRIESLRGNLDTRIKKLDEGLYDAIILASAGVIRLGWQDRITEILDEQISLPAVGQGAVGIETRIDDHFVNDLVKPLNDYYTNICVSAERAFLKRLEGGCQVPIASHGIISDNNNEITLHGLIGSINGDKIIKGSIKGSISESIALAIKLAEELLDKGADTILKAVYER